MKKTALLLSALLFVLAEPHLMAQAAKEHHLQVGQTHVVQAEDYDEGGRGVAYEARQRIYTNPTGDQFPILGWLSIGSFDPSEVTRHNYELMAQAGFNLSLTSFYTIESKQMLLDSCRGTGVKQMLQVASEQGIAATISQLKDDEMLGGWFFTDEPPVSRFPDLAAQANEVKKYDLAHPLYLNLLPTYGLFASGTNNYEDYVERFVNEVNMGLISFDNYPITTNTNGSGVTVRSDFYENLTTISKVARRHNWPFWAFALAVPHYSYPEPTIQHLRYQIMSNLAYGAQGIQYFTYVTPKDDPGAGYHMAPMDEGKITDTYYVVKEMNEEVHALSWAFLGAKVVEVGHTGSQIPTGSTRFENLPAKFQRLTASGQGVLVSHLVNGLNHFLLVLNRNINNSQRVSIRKDDDVMRVMRTGNEVADSERVVEIPAGDYLLYHWTD